MRIHDYDELMAAFGREKLGMKMKCHSLSITIVTNFFLKDPAPYFWSVFFDLVEPSRCC